MKKGVKAARGNILVFLDGDGSHSPSCIPRMIKELKKYDVVLATLSLNKKTKDLQLKLLYSIYIPIMRKYFGLFGLKLKGDPLTEFRVMKKETWERLRLKSNDFLIETEMNFKILKLGLKIKEINIPIVRRAGGIFKSKLLKQPDQWIKIFNYGIKFAKDEKIKKQIKNLKKKLLKKLLNFQI